MDNDTQIYLSKPGGQRQGPFTLAQIKHSLAANIYRDTDYWAWHEGLPEWVPLYNLPGISDDEAPAAPASPAASAEPVAAPVAPPAPTPAPSPAAAPPEAEFDLVPLPPEVASGMPFAALEHIFLFTTGDGPAAWEASEVGRMLESVVGAELDLIRQNVPRDVVARCAPDGLLKPDGSISEAVWRVMEAHQPDLVQQARKRLHRICVRTFRVGADTVAALILFYDKEKL